MAMMEGECAKIELKLCNQGDETVRVFPYYRSSL